MEWINCNDRLPEKDGEYLVAVSYNTSWIKKNGCYYTVLRYAEGWNCVRHPDGSVSRNNEFDNVLAWAEIGPYGGCDGM